MKYLLSLLLTTSAFASITPVEYAQIKAQAPRVMMKVGARPELNPKIVRFGIVDELGFRVTAKFTYTEEMYGARTCTYIYDLNTADVVQNSWLCPN